MLLQLEDGVSAEHYTNRIHNKELLGFLPILCDGLSYYSMNNIGTNSDFERITPVLGEYRDNIRTDLEYWYLDDFKKGGREEDRLQHEMYRDDYIERIETHQYCVWFVGCDDGDLFMRFKTKEDALEYLECVDFLDEVYKDPYCMYW